MITYLFTMAKGLTNKEVMIRLFEISQIVCFLAVFYMVENLMATMDWFFRFMLVSISIVILLPFFKEIQKKI